MSHNWWFVSRATGIVAGVLAVVALVLGFFFSSRNTGEKRNPAWWLDLHNWVGGLALAFTAVHVITIYLDHNSGIGALQVLVPGTTAVSPWSITWGVVATYLLFIVVFTSWPKRRLSRRTWRILHLSSIAVVALAGLHAFQSGTDATGLAFEASLVVLGAFGVYALAVRVLAVLQQHWR